MARNSKKKDGPFQPSPDSVRVIPLGGGTWAYIYDATGKLHHVKRDSDAMVEVCRETDAAMGGKISKQLAKLGWEDVLEKMNG